MDKSKAKCHNCKNLGHFSRECSQAKKLHSCNSTALVCSQSLMVGSYFDHLWVIDSVASDLIACQKGMFWDFQKIKAERMKLYAGNG